MERDALIKKREEVAYNLRHASRQGFATELLQDELNQLDKEMQDAEKHTKIEKLKDLLGLVSEVDIMYHEERKEYFFEWMKDGKFITIWLGDYI